MLRWLLRRRTVTDRRCPECGGRMGRMLTSFGRVRYDCERCTYTIIKRR